MGSHILTKNYFSVAENATLEVKKYKTLNKDIDHMANGSLEFDTRDSLGTQQLDFQKGKARFSSNNL